MGKRDRERKARVTVGAEHPFAVQFADVPFRLMAAHGTFMSAPLRELRAGTKEGAMESVSAYAKSLGLHPRTEDDEGDMLTIGLYCKHGRSDVAVVLAEDEDSEGWYCLEEQLNFETCCSTVRK
jgi:hypothetical protein